MKIRSKRIESPKEMVKSLNQFQIKKGNTFPLGASLTDCGIQFSMVNSKDEDAGIVLINKKNPKDKTRIPFPEGCRMGNISSMIVKDISNDDYAYRFFEGDTEYVDPYSGRILGNEVFGVKDDSTYELSSDLDLNGFDWKDDRILCTPFSDSILYLLHVRGFTKHSSSKVAHPGTFLGIVDKIPHLKSLGITAVELMPCYEFEEYQKPEDKKKSPDYNALTDANSKKVNFWGYQNGFYFAPKASYAAGDDACFEMRTFVREMHKAGIEVIMQLYFPDNIKSGMIQDVIRHWVMNYHIDGFHLKGNKIPISLLATDPLFANTKLMYDYIPEDEIYSLESKPKYKNLCVYSDEYMYQIRKFLKADPDMLSEFVRLEKRIPERTAIVNFITNYYGFTLNDLYSYDTKHNEENGENNRDGCNSNYSWNCGAEGKTKKKSIIALRIRMMKNALITLLFGAGTPLLVAGDEFMNSQNGNNNAYCQDNETGYVNWNTTKSALEFLEFTKEMIAFRKSKAFLNLFDELTMSDLAQCGFPDLSFHQEEAWKADLSGDKHHIGVMFTELVDVAKDKKNDKDRRKVLGTKYARLYYIAFNMHWEERKFSMPNLIKKAKWNQIYSSGDDAVKFMDGNNLSFDVPARTVVIFEAK